VANPYESPVSNDEPTDSPITPELLRQLLAGEGTRELIIGDVSDIQLYGKKHCLRLKGAMATQAEQAGLEPEVYQAALWWTLVGIPVWPQTTCLVLAQKETAKKLALDDDRFRILPIARDHGQIRRHYRNAAVVLVVSIALISWLLLSWFSARV
jgi:hypothetical protein